MILPWHSPWQGPHHFPSIRLRSAVVAEWVVQTVVEAAQAVRSAVVVAVEAVVAVVVVAAQASLMEVAQAAPQGSCPHQYCSLPAHSIGRMLPQHVRRIAVASSLVQVACQFLLHAHNCHRALPTAPRAIHTLCVS